jgi:hypothetical protein
MASFALEGERRNSEKRKEGGIKEERMWTDEET